MRKVILFSVLLLIGIVLGQYLDLHAFEFPLEAAVSVCLAFIMIEVGLEFSLEDLTLRDFGRDAVTALSAAILPALLWGGYFLLVIREPWTGSIAAGISAAPTSAGILFSMLIAAGLQRTWVFKKARVLAVLDDLATILMLVPLQFLLTGPQAGTFIVLGLIGVFIVASFRWRNTLPWPSSPGWLFGYACALALTVLWLKKTSHIHIEVLVPAFMWGCMLHSGTHAEASAKEHPRAFPLDAVVKSVFMILVGLSFPRIHLGQVPLAAMLGHLLALTLLSNIGKAVCVLYYQKEASLRERLALGIAMFPRGEVGAAVLLVAAASGIGGTAGTLAMMGLAVNLLLTGVFIAAVMRLLQDQSAPYGA